MAVSGQRIFSDFGETKPWSSVALVPLSETQVFSYTVPGGNKFIVFSSQFTGGADAIMKLKVDGTVLATGRTAWTKRTVGNDFPVGHKVLPGSVITVTVLSTGEAAADFFGYINGILI